MSRLTTQVGQRPIQKVQKQVEPLKVDGEASEGHGELGNEPCHHPPFKGAVSRCTVLANNKGPAGECGGT